ncbi:hypothetical protein VN97_g3198 [Penicillium thymicola]|uniref:Uncharacterized protein n=1 Tax=Penicillium thymicola TaxID=293382 RepID=A0AAI9TN41_PENTH|nr:hypothetical protein VN97_g3198 [Penicillium thymicola]
MGCGPGGLLRSMPVNPPHHHHYRRSLSHVGSGLLRLAYAGIPLDERDLALLPVRWGNPTCCGVGIARATGYWCAVSNPESSAKKKLAPPGIEPGLTQIRNNHNVSSYH